MLLLNYSVSFVIFNNRLRSLDILHLLQIIVEVTVERYLDEGEILVPRLPICATVQVRLHDILQQGTEDLLCALGILLQRPVEEVDLADSYVVLRQRLLHKRHHGVRCHDLVRWSTSNQVPQLYGALTLFH